MSGLYLTAAGTAALAFHVAAGWDLGVPPGLGDQAYVPSGFTRTISQAQQVGTSPDGSTPTTANLAVDVGITGKLAFTAGGSLRCRGPARIQNNTGLTVLDAIDMNGGEWIWDASAAAAPTTSNYRLLVGSAAFNYRRIRMVDSYMWSDEGGIGAAHGYLTGAGANGTPAYIRTSKFWRVGDATRPVLSQCIKDTANTVFDLADVWFDECGQAIDTAGSNITGTLGTYSIVRVTTTNTVATTSAKFSGNTGATATSRVVVDNCRFDKSVNFIVPNGVYVTNTWFLSSYTITVNSSNPVGCSQWDDVFAYVNFPASGGAGYPQAIAPCPTMLRETRLFSATEANMKGLGLTFFSVTHTDGYMESLGATTTDGEYISVNGAPSGGVSTFTGLIVPPYKDGKGTRVVEVLDNTTHRVDVVHCSVAAMQPTGGLVRTTVGQTFGIGHNAATDGRERIRVKGTLFWNFRAGASNTGKAGAINAGIDPLDNMTDASDYNCGYGVTGAITGGLQGKGYDFRSTAAPGAHDVDVDPWSGTKPLGPTVRFWTWADAIGFTNGAGYTTTALKEAAALTALNVSLLGGAVRYGLTTPTHANFNGSATVPNFRTAARNDWIPTNAAIATAAHDGGTIGAMAYASVGAAPEITLAGGPVTFSATVGGASPAAATSAIANTGTGTLDGLATSIGYGSGSGWLAATLDTTTAPAVLTITPTLGSLAAGTYTATVSVTSTASGVTNSPQTVGVTFTVAAAGTGVTGVSVTPSSFALNVGGTQQLTPTVLGPASPSQAVTYTSGTPSLATVSGGGLVTGVAAGSVTITVRSVVDPSQSATVAVTVAVASAPSTTTRVARLRDMLGAVRVTPRAGRPARPSRSSRPRRR